MTFKFGYCDVALNETRAKYLFTFSSFQKRPIALNINEQLKQLKLRRGYNFVAPFHAAKKDVLLVTVLSYFTVVKKFFIFH